MLTFTVRFFFFHSRLPPPILFFIKPRLLFSFPWIDFCGILSGIFCSWLPWKWLNDSVFGWWNHEGELFCVLPWLCLAGLQKKLTTNMKFC
ncbi:hypothetical protein O6P43_010063 [Quillaja saponaria]|uniref:Uncharacterized protein n=1 Tax=Quillaja saponaria TaxID=32244 RepID=A0AAD7VDY9_QUISA|nr:hypothetical protein O6P43_010063 [Quillaja saponaria]